VAALEIVTFDMKPPTGQEIGNEILLDHRSVRLTKKTTTLKSLRCHLAHLHKVIPKSVIKDGVAAQLSWIYEVFRKGAPNDPRASLPHEEIIEEMIIVLSLGIILTTPTESARYLEFWAKRKKSRANARGGKARAMKDAKKNAEKYCDIFFD
jgi:hypothetical protein